MKACDMGVVYHNQPTHYVMYLFTYREDTGGNSEQNWSCIHIIPFALCTWENNSKNHNHYESCAVHQIYNKTLHDTYNRTHELCVIV